MKTFEISFPYTVHYQNNETEYKTATEIVKNTDNESLAFCNARNMVEKRELRVYQAVCVVLPPIDNATIKEISENEINKELESIFNDEQFKDLLK